MATEKTSGLFGTLGAIPKALFQVYTLAENMTKMQHAIEKTQEQVVRQAEITAQQSARQAEIDAQQSAGAGTGGYIFLDLLDDKRTLFHDLLKGFEEYAQLKGYQVYFSIDNSYSNKIA